MIEIIFVIETMVCAVVTFFVLRYCFREMWQEIKEELRQSKRKIPCENCDSMELLVNLGQCGDCGSMFCGRCINLRIVEGSGYSPRICKKCEEKQKKKIDAGFPIGFAKRQADIHGFKDLRNLPKRKLEREDDD